MSTGMLHLHSFIPYLLLPLLIYTFVISLIGWQSDKAMSGGTFKIAKITFILSHVQLLVGLILFFVSPMVEAAMSSGNVMKNAFNREVVVEHPVTMIIGIALMTIGYVKAKKMSPEARNKRIALFYGFALVLFMTMIPWDRWF